MEWKVWQEHLICNREQAGKGLLVAIGTELQNLIAGPMKPLRVDHTLKKCPGGEQSANCFLMWNLQPDSHPEQLLPLTALDYIPASSSH